MVTIKVNDSGECRVTVRGPWDTVKKNLETAAKKLREMAVDSKQFAQIAEGTFMPPMQTPRQQPRQPREEPLQEFHPDQQTPWRLREDHPQEFRPARQPQIVHPVPVDREFGDMGTGLHGAGSGGGAA